jgi:hypothetical protein
MEQVRSRVREKTRRHAARGSLAARIKAPKGGPTRGFGWCRCRPGLPNPTRWRTLAWIWRSPRIRTTDRHGPIEAALEIVGTLAEFFL